MKKNTWLLLFTLLFIGDLVAIQWGDAAMESVCKPLVIPFLVGYFSLQIKSTTGRLKKWIFTALFFSWVGDILLLFQENGQLFFLLGLSCFLLAHLCYICFFYTVIQTETIKKNLTVILIGILYGAGMIFFLSPRLGAMRWPVYLYSAVIITMFIMATHMLFIKRKTIGQYLMIGALLFVISDSILAVNKFYQPFWIAGVLIMLTYGMAQLLIVKGSA